jgi:hypothetical protein
VRFFVLCIAVIKKVLTFVETNKENMKAQVLNQLIKNGNSVEESIKMANSYLLEQAIKAGHKTAKKIAMYIVRFY